MLNKVLLRGYVADDPYIRATEGGKMAQLRVATIERVTIEKSGVLREHTEWHSVTLWNNLADLTDERVRVGMAIEVEGALRTRDWEDRRGKMHRTTVIVASSLHIIEGAIEEYPLPTAIVERRDALYPTKRCNTTPQREVTKPAEDPDNLPF